MAYIEKTDIQSYMGLTISSGLDTFIGNLISAVTRYIEQYCGGDVVERRWFEDDDTSKTFYYDGNDNIRLVIDDLRTLTSLTVDGTSLTDGDDFYLYPLNAQADSNFERPYEWIELIQPETRISVNSRIQSTSPYIFDVGQKIVKVIGKFGYSTTPPDDIQFVAMKLASGIIKENIGDSDLREVTSENLGEYSSSFAKIKEVANRLEVNSILDQYKRKKLFGKDDGIIKVS